MKTVFITIFLIFVNLFSYAQGYFWVGGSGNWSDLNHWATTSGGSTLQTQLPTSTDNVIFDANSFTATSQVVTLDVAADCKNMDWSGVANFPTITGNGNDLNVYGSITLSPDMAADFNDINFESTATGNTISSNGTSLGSSSVCRFNGDGGEWSLLDNINTNGIFLTAGTFTTNNNNVSSGDWFKTSGSMIKTINLGSSVISSIRWWIYGSNLSINAGTSKIITSLFYGDAEGNGPYTYYDVEFNSGGILKYSSTFNEITIVEGETLTLQSGTVFTLNNLVANGTKHNPIKIKSSSAGSEGTFKKTSGSITVNYVELSDIYANGGASFTANNSTGNGNTNGWTINSLVGQDYFWVGNSGNWSDFANHWATTSGGSTMHTDYPGKADNAYFDGNSFTSSGQTVTLDLNANVRDMDWSGVSNNPTVSMSFSYTLNVYGSVTFTPEVNKNIWNMVLSGSGTYTNSITGAVLNFSVDAPGGTYTLQDSLYAQSIIIEQGTFTLNNNPIKSTINILVTGSSVSTILNMGSSNLYAKKLRMNNYTFQPIINAGTSTLFLEQGVSIQSNTVSGFSFNNVVLSGSATMEGSNTYAYLTLEPGASVAFEENEVTTITNSFNLTGTKSNPITLNSTVAGTQSTISMSSGTVNGIYLLLQDIAASGGATFNADQTIDNGNNTGWNITGLTGLDYYWVGNSGNWSDYANHWVTASGGSSFHSSAPGVLDNVFFDANSFTTTGETVTIDQAQISFTNLEAGSVNNSFTLSAANKELNIYGSVNLSPMVNLSLGTSAINLLSTGSETLNFNNGPGNSTDIYLKSAGTWTLSSDLTVDQLHFESGTFNTNDKAVTIDFELRFWLSNPKVLNLGTSSFYARKWVDSNAENITINGGSSEASVSSSFNVANLGTNSITLNNLTFKSVNGSATTLYGDLTLNKCTFEPGVILKTIGTPTITANEFILIGTETNPIVFEPQTAISSLTLSQASGTVNGDYLHLQDITATGGATFNAYNSIDNGNVIGWIFYRNSQTITFNPLADKILGDPDFDVTATASSGLPVSFSIVSGPATISGNTISLTGVGTVEVKAEQGGDIAYDPAPSVTQSFNVATTGQTIDFSSISDKTFGDSPFALAATATSGLEVSFSVVSGPISISGNTVTITGAGIAEIMASQAGSVNYAAAADVTQMFTINKANQTITFNPLNDVLLSDASNILLSASSTSGLEIVFSVSGPATISGNTLTGTATGTVTVTASQPGNENYDAATDVSQSFKITDTITGLEELTDNGLSIYPQPAAGEVYIKQNKATFDELALYSMDGVLQISNKALSETTEINLNNLPNGIYILKLVGSHSAITRRVIVGE